MAEHPERQVAVVLTARDGQPLLTAAGLWDEWKDRETGERLKSCTRAADPRQAAANSTLSIINAA